MPELLTGTVTFLFSDIEGSTRAAQSLGPRWPAILERHRELLRAAFKAEGGEEAGTEGDSFFVAFPTAPGAVAAAVLAQRALAAEPWSPDGEIRVRIGLHTGEAGFSTDSYVGLHVHRASRIASAGHGGQVLLSDATRVLAAHQLPAGVELRDLGEHRLKDLDRPEHLFQLVIEGLPNEFAPIGSLVGAPNNLPIHPTTFLGREREIDEVVGLLGEHRLLTLTGPGGTGKTRLSLEAAARALEQHPAGVYFVELASISQAELVPQEIAQAIGLPDRGGRSAVDRLIDYIGDRRMLLVLDNLEQVVGAGSSVSQLLAACPQLRVLTSSRSALHVSGEQEYSVRPMGLPDLAHLPERDELSQYDAVALFIERARSVKPDFSVTNDNAPAVAEICVRLDGLPLAIELAAARIRILSPQAMLARLEHRLSLLAGGSRDLPERQQTLRNAIAWSHDMLDETDRAFFAGLAVFAGGARLEAIERVAGPEVSGDVLDAISSLVDKSLVRQWEGVGGEPRFGMLETIREYAVERAAELGTVDQLRERHAGFFGELVDAARGEIMGSGKRNWLDLLDEDRDNLRAALGWLIETDRAEAALRMSAALWRFWQMRGYLSEGASLVEAALAMPHAAAHPAPRADGLSAAAGLAYWQGDPSRSRAYYRQEIELRRQLGDRAGLAEALYGISFTWTVSAAVGQQDTAAAAASIEEGLSIFRELGDDLGVGRCEWALANVTYSARQFVEAMEHAATSLAIFEAADDRFMVGWAKFTLGAAGLGLDMVAGGAPEARAAARESFADALAVFAEANDSSAYTLVLDAIALVALRNGDRPRAARLSGAVARLERETGTGLNIWGREMLDFRPDELRDDPALAAEWRAGEALSNGDAVALALEVKAPSTAAPAGHDPSR